MLELNYTNSETVNLIKGNHISHELYKDIQFVHDQSTNFYQVICTKHDNTQCNIYIGYDGSSARRAYNRIIASAHED